jgi:hypothetical protein
MNASFCIRNLEISTPISNKQDNGNLSYKSKILTKKSIRKDHEAPKRNKLGCATPETPSKSLNATSESQLKNQGKNNTKIRKEPILITSDDDEDSNSIPEVS